MEGICLIRKGLLVAPVHVYHLPHFLIRSSTKQNCLFSSNLFLFIFFSCLSLVDFFYLYTEDKRIPIFFFLFKYYLLGLSTKAGKIVLGVLFFFRGGGGRNSYSSVQLNRGNISSCFIFF